MFPLRPLTPAQEKFILAVPPDETVHIGNAWTYPYVGGLKLPCGADVLLRLLGLRVFEFVPDDPVRLRYTLEGRRLHDDLAHRPQKIRFAPEDLTVVAPWLTEALPYRR